MQRRIDEHDVARLDRAFDAGLESAAKALAADTKHRPLRKPIARIHSTGPRARRNQRALR